ncbi:MAG: hypothetical protein AAFV53_42780 [Myxococcota bacterium]
MHLSWISFLLVACGGSKAPPAPAVAAADVAPEPEPAALPEPEPAPEPEPLPNNVNFRVTLTYADGSSKSGQVVRLERSEDFYGEEGWSLDPGDIKINADGGNEYKKIPWSDLRNITVKAGAIPGDVNCFYSSEYNPWMYECTLKTTATMTDSAGKRWTVDSAHKWRLTFDDETAAEFWLKKHHARQQDDKEIGLSEDSAENFNLYTSLQGQLREAVQGDLVVAIRVEP